MLMHLEGELRFFLIVCKPEAFAFFDPILDPHFTDRPQVLDVGLTVQAAEFLEFFACFKRYTFMARIESFFPAAFQDLAFHFTLAPLPACLWTLEPGHEIEHFTETVVIL